MARRSVAARADFHGVRKVGTGYSFDDYAAAAETAEANSKQRTEENKVKRFFAYSECGFTFHDTAEEAKAEAERLLEVEHDFAIRDGEWSDDAFCIIWGEVRGRINERWVDATGDEDEYVELTLEDVRQ